MELKHPTLKQPPPIEEEIDSKEKKESSEERATPDFTGDCMQMLLVCGIYCVSWFRLSKHAYICSHVSCTVPQITATVDCSYD